MEEFSLYRNTTHGGFMTLDSDTQARPGDLVGMPLPDDYILVAEFTGQEHLGIVLDVPDYRDQCEWRDATWERVAKASEKLPALPPVDRTTPREKARSKRVYWPRRLAIAQRESVPKPTEARHDITLSAEATALYALHYFSRSSGWFRLSLGVSGGLLMAFSLIHGTASIFDLIGVAELSETVTYYSRVVAFPLLAGLVGLSVVAITMTHPKNIIRLKQAAAHTRIAVGRAEAASELELMRSQGILDRARRDHRREQTKLEEEELIDLQKLIAIDERKAQMVMAISNPQLRESLARELGIDLKALGSQNHTQTPRGNGNAYPQQRPGVLD